MHERDVEQGKLLQAVRESLEEHGKAAVQAATGYGKSHCIQKFIKLLNPNQTMLVVAPRVNLVKDLAERLDANVYCASLNRKETGRIVVATKQSIKDIKADLIVLDEMHNYNEAFLSTINASMVIGLSATPWNNHGYIWDQYYWPEPCYRFSIKESIEAKFLTPYQIFGSKHAFEIIESKNKRGDYTETEIKKMVTTPKYIDQVLEITELCNFYKRKKVAILCANIEHAEIITEEFLKYEPCMVIHSKLKNASGLIDEYKNNDVRFCVSIMMMSEGTDIPPIDAIVYLRPTKSSRLMSQSAGRGLRLFDNKEFCLMLDYGFVFQSCGTPHNPIIPINQKTETRDPDEPMMKQCEKCFHIWDGKESKECPSCGHVPKVEVDNDKNLKKSIVDQEEQFKMFISARNIYKRGVSRNRLPYLTLLKDGKYYTLFGGQIKWLLGSLKPDAVITYAKDNKQEFRIIGIKPKEVVVFV